MTDDEMIKAWHDDETVRFIHTDYVFVGHIQTVFLKRNGQTRCVVENYDRLLHIQSAKNLELVHESE